MSENYQRLLDSTIEHLKWLKASGRQFVVVNGQTLKDLQAPAPLPRIEFSPEQQLPVVKQQPTIEQPKLAATTGEPVAARAVTGVTNERAAAMAEIRERAMACLKCPNLVAARKNVVFGVGDINAELMFIGEAPGADEDAQGEPFVGAAGQLLTRIIKAMGLSRETVYIANILKCRPDTPGQTAGNRKPTSDEMKTCLPYLLAQIDVIKPKVIVALGATAVEGLLGKTEGITKLRGKLQTFRDTPLMPTFHPAYLLRNQAISEKRKVWEDMLQVMERMNLPITEKQRGFFLHS
jgi:uracil-DNA glycosylase family 4